MVRSNFEASCFSVTRNNLMIVGEKRGGSLRSKTWKWVKKRLLGIFFNGISGVMWYILLCFLPLWESESLSLTVLFYNSVNCRKLTVLQMNLIQWRCNESPCPALAMEEVSCENTNAFQHSPLPLHVSTLWISLWTGCNILLVPLLINN